MQVRFSSFAEADLDEIHAYITRRDTTAAARFVDDLLRSAFRLARFPYRGRNGRIENTREFSVPGTSYFLIYTLSEASIDIERVLHSRRQYPPID
jgi:addiction module RelE/StbE family toxin